ncbi:hypothetical protein [Paraburkholderia sp. RL17-381-BIF-C]|uniref:hypothetical protein n=1 Tax=Paraburkholderia sp. RL17-381-BIF-C TaxID=3031635 RepID=UPI0038B919C3
MKTQMKSFAEPTDLPKELVVIAVAADRDVGKYLLSRSRKSKDSSQQTTKKTSFGFRASQPSREIGVSYAQKTAV